MKEDSVVTFRGPDAAIVDPLTEVLHRGARKLLAKAIAAEVEGVLRQNISHRGWLDLREHLAHLGGHSSNLLLVA